MNHEPDSTLAVTKTCPKDGVHLSVAAILTPTHDLVTLMLTTLPLFVVYVLCVLIAWGFAGPSLDDSADPSHPQQGSAV